MSYLHNDKNILFIDLEMTGVFKKRPASAELIEIAMIYIEDFSYSSPNTHEVYHRLVKPKMPIDKYIEDMTGITNKELSTKKSIKHYRNEIQEYIDKADLIVFHGGKYDKLALKCAGIDLQGSTFFDTEVMMKRLYPECSKTNLQFTNEFFGYSQENYHNALDDTIAVINAFVELTDTSKDVWEKYSTHYKALAQGFSYTL